MAEPRTRRQWGAERRSEPLSIVHPVPSAAKITWGRVAIVVTILSWIGYVVSTILREFIDYGGSFRFTMEAFSYVLVVTFLTFSALMYLVARQGALLRFRSHVRAPRGLIDRHFAEAPSQRLTVLIPSYAEEPDVVRLTMWSAALQEYPDLHLVLLIDDPPAPTDPAVRAKLEATRRLAPDIQEALREPRERFQASLAAAEATLARGKGRRRSVKTALADYHAAADWLEAMAQAEQVVDHVSEFFVDQVLVGLANELRLTALALQAALDQGGLPEPSRILELQRRLAWIFRADLTSFERKAYGSLSHEANKAMNVNAYLGLMGHVWRPQHTALGVMLDEVETAEPGDLDIPDSGYVLTLDADSQLLRDYCIRLVFYLEQEQNQHVAIIQTPYSSFRGAPTRIERIAGASTDLQHILHQGKTHHNATFWVGANAVIRKSALEDIVEVENIGGHDVKTYIQDRTVIEDTESSIDIGTAGWTLVNYPERLSYSATPPDFGSLVVQRRRWANGGLLILPKLWEQMRHRRHSGTRVHLTELALRVNYMASIAWASFGLLFLLFYPYDSRLLSPLVLGAALPYFLAMGSDLRACGHRFTDIFRIYGFNLVLLPVNLAGVLKSVQQAFTGEKIPFARTPKVRNRTAAPALHVMVPYLIVLFSLLTAWRDYQQENWGNAGFAMFNAILATVAISSYIGVRASLVDMGLGVLNWLFVEPRPKKAAAPAPAPADGAIDWATILYYGDRRLARDLRRSGDRRRRLRRTNA
ncbi:glycosyltransferase family 2 protein [Aeromicrobium chenweiae]|uniref:glycosyltransferase family 2 protein n=1 Tax=Aeromicrobium chenweiae TaxID=2079793 RepID=UPI001F480E3B|nr:glycosyltransferase family 2 protein [Aeromicrobium chenweiae]